MQIKLLCSIRLPKKRALSAYIEVVVVVVYNRGFQEASKSGPSAPTLIGQNRTTFRFRVFSY